MAANLALKWLKNFLKGEEFQVDNHPISDYNP